MLQRLCSRCGNVMVVASAVIWATVIGASAVVERNAMPHLVLILGGGAVAHVLILGRAGRRRQEL